MKKLLPKIAFLGPNVLHGGWQGGDFLAKKFPSARAGLAILAARKTKILDR